MPLFHVTLLPLAYILKGHPFFLGDVFASGDTVRVTAVGGIVEEILDVSVGFIIRECDFYRSSSKFYLWGDLLYRRGHYVWLLFTSGFWSFVRVLL